MRAWSMVRTLGAALVPFLLMSCGDTSTKPATRKTEIVAFGASPSMVTEEGSTTLNWITSNATSIRLVDDGETPIDLRGAAPEMGSVTVQPGKTREYRLFAKGPGGEVSRAVTVEVLADGVSARLWLEPGIVSYGEKTTLHWESQHASFVTVTQDGKTIVSSAAELSGTKEIETLDSLEFAIEASGPLGTATATAILQVKPIVEEFSTPQVKPVYPGENVELRWVTKGADALRISNLDGWEQDVPKQNVGKGSLVAKAGRDGTFSLVASRVGVEETRELAVELAGPPSIVRFVAEPGGITEGKSVAEKVRLSWHLGNAKSIRLESDHHGVIDVSGKKTTFDSVEVANVPAGTVFTLRASNASANAEETLSFDSVPLARVEEFRAVPARVGGEEPVTLVWKTEGASEIELRAGELRLSANRHHVDGQFETTVKGNASFDLIAKNHGGDSVFETLDILLGAPQVTFTSAKPQVRPGADLTFRWKNLGGNRLQILKDGSPVFESEDPWLIDEGEGTVQAPSQEGYHKYELAVSNALGTGKATIDMLVSDGPEIVSFTASPGPLKAGGNVTFAWDVQNDRLGRTPALQLVDDLDNVYDISSENPNQGSASLPVDDPGIRTFTLIASTGSSYPSLALATSSIFGDPEIVFAATPPDFDPFERVPVRLSWQVKYATKLWLHRANAAGVIQETLIETDRASTVQRSFRDLIPQPPEQTYILEVENPWGERASEELLVRNPHPIKSFTISPSTVSKGTPVTVSWDTEGGTPYLGGPLQVLSMNQRPNTFQTIVGQTGTNSVSYRACPSSTDDEGCKELDFPAGFEFPFDGKQYSRVRVFTNGFINLNLSVADPATTYPTYPGTVLPDASKLYAQLVAYGRDLWCSPNFYWRHGWDSGGQYVTVEWLGSCGWPGAGFQMVLWETGAFEYRYGNMTVNAPNFVGYQNETGTVGYNIPSGTTISTLANRAWKYDPQVSSIGNRTMTPNGSTFVRLCVYNAAGKSVCEDRSVTVTP